MVQSILEDAQQRRFRREIRALANSALDADGFAVAVQFHDELGQLLRERARDLTDEFSWREIGEALHITRQGAQQRFGRR